MNFSIDLYSSRVTEYSSERHLDQSKCLFLMSVRHSAYKKTTAYEAQHTLHV